MGTPFKMKGFSGFGNSPLQQGFSGAGSNISISGGEDKKTMAEFSLDPGVEFGKFKFGGKFAQKDFTKDKFGKSGKDARTFVGASGKFNISNRRSRVYDASFAGSLSGNVGLNPKSKKLGYSGRASVGVGRPGSFTMCTGKFCAGGPDVTAWNIKAFGEHGSKESFSPGTKVGVSGRFGWLKGEGSYDIKTKKPEFKIGISVPFNR